MILKIRNRLLTIAENSTFSKDYVLNCNNKLINFCLNCKKEDCNGNCEDYKNFAKKVHQERRAEISQQF